MNNEGPCQTGRNVQAHHALVFAAAASRILLSNKRPSHEETVLIV